MTTQKDNAIDLAAQFAQFGIQLGDIDKVAEDLAADLARDKFKRLYKWQSGSQTLRIYPAVIDPETSEPAWYAKGKVHFFNRADGRIVPVPCAMAYASKRGEEADCWGCRQVAAMYRAGNDEEGKRAKAKTQYYIAAIVRGAEQEKLGLQIVPLSRAAMAAIGKAIKAHLDDCEPNDRDVFHPINGHDIVIEKSSDENNPWTANVRRRPSPILSQFMKVGPGNKPLPINMTEFFTAFEALAAQREELALQTVIAPMTEPEIIQMMQGDGGSGGGTQRALPAASKPANIEAQLRSSNKRIVPEAEQYYGGGDEEYEPDEPETEADDNVPF